MKIKMNKRFWQVGAAVVVVVVIILLVVLLPSSGETPGPTPTPTSVATATGAGKPTATATGVGYPTATSTEVSQPTATSTEVSQPTATATGETHPLETVYFDKSVYTVSRGTSFDVHIMWSGTDEGLWGGQMDITYDESLITYTSSANGSIDGQTPDQCVAGLFPNDVQGKVRVLTYYSTYFFDNNCCGMMGDGCFITLTFTADTSNTGTTDLSFVPVLELNGDCDLIDECASIPYTFNCTWINSTVNVQ